MNEPRGEITARVERAVAALIRETEALRAVDPVVVAVSGGTDSLCLLHALHRLSASLSLSLHVAHLNHLLRGADADGDATFVAEQAAYLGLPCSVGSRDVAAHARAREVSLEEAAREVRYGFLREVARDIGAGVVATGHTRDDAVETVMLHILRGSGIHGLRGLAAVTRYPLSAVDASLGDAPRLVRPLLGISRAETMAYCLKMGVRPRVDATNESLAHLRNRVRLELLPLMRDLNPGVDDGLLRLAALANEDDDALSRIARDEWERLVRVTECGLEIDVEAFLALHPAVQSRLVRETVANLCGNMQDVSFGHVSAVRSVAAGSSGKWLELPGGTCWRREYGRLVACRSCQDSAPLDAMPDTPVPLCVPGEVSLPGGRLMACRVEAGDAVRNAAFVAYLDVASSQGGLVVRRRRPGDRFRPLGMSGQRKLQDFMVDCHIPARDRDAVPVVCSPEHIVWVVGWRIDDRVKVTCSTREVVRLVFVPHA
jgi:tRNA(Ile)-lysidine synthase